MLMLVGNIYKKIVELYRALQNETFILVSCQYAFNDTRK